MPSNNNPFRLRNVPSYAGIFVLCWIITLLVLTAFFRLVEMVIPEQWMGSKKRSFAPLIYVSVEELVPHDHFYRHLERTLALSFVHEFVQEQLDDLELQVVVL